MTVTTTANREVSSSVRRSLAGPLAGVAVTLLSLVATPPEGPETLTAAAIRAWVEQHESTLRTYGAVMALTALAVLLFISHLRELMRVEDPDRAHLGDIAYGSAVICAVWLLVSGTTTSVIAFDLESLSDEMVVQYYGLAGVGDMLGTIALVFKAALLISVSLVAARTGFLPRWLSWTGLVLGVLTFGGIIGAFTDATIAGGLMYAGLFAFALWPLPVGICLTIRALRARRA